MLHYRVEAGPVVHLQERGERRRNLYAEMLKEFREDWELLSLLVRIRRAGVLHVDTLTYNSVAIPEAHVREVVRLLAATGRAGFAWGGRAEVRFEGREVGEGKMSVVARLVPGGEVLSDALVLPGIVVQGGVAWEVADEVRRGRFELEGQRLRRFLLEHDVAIERLPVRRRLQLKDPFGCFVQLLEGDAADLLDVGYQRRGSEFVIASDRAVEAVALLLGVGWEVTERAGRQVVAESERAIRVDEGGVGGWVRFGEAQVGLEQVGGRGLVDFGGKVVGWAERAAPRPGKVALWELDRLLGVAGVEWAPALKEGALRFRGEGIPRALPGAGFRGQLLDYQQLGVDWLSFLQAGGYGALLADEMGLGKTVQAAAFFSRLSPEAKVLVVAPTSLVCNWERELDRFLGKHGVRVISYARLRLDVKVLAREEFDVVLLDEAQMIKNSKTQVAQAARELRARFRISLSGTPIENRAEELESQFAFLMPGYLSGRALVREQVKPFILRRRKEDVGLQLPPRRDQIVWLEMGEEQRSLYEEVKRGIRPLVESGEPMQVLEAILRLRQVCVDPRLVDPEAGRGVKAEQMAIDLEGEGKWLIFSQFTAALKMLRQEMPDALYLDGEMGPLARTEVVAQFQEGAQRHFLLSLKAGGVGLNLTAADRVLLLDPWWNDAVEEQAIARAHRIGQTRPLHVIRYLIANTIEERMHELKAKKRVVSDDLLGEPIEALTLEDWRHLLD